MKTKEKPQDQRLALFAKLWTLDPYEHSSFSTITQFFASVEAKWSAALRPGREAKRQRVAFQLVDPLLRFLQFVDEIDWSHSRRVQRDRIQIDANGSRALRNRAQLGHDLAL